MTHADRGTIGHRPLPREVPTQDVHSTRRRGPREVWTRQPDSAAPALSGWAPGRLTGPDGCPRLSETHDLELSSDLGAPVASHAGDDGWGGARTFLRDQVGIAHATLQVEPRTGSGCSELDSW